MCRRSFPLFFLCLLVAPAVGIGQDKAKPDPKQKPKPPGPVLAELLKAGPEEFIKRFDKNQDGFLTADELPPRLADALGQVDANKDGKLNKDEVGTLLARLRKQFDPTPAPPAANDEQLNQVVAKLLTRFDANKDGVVSKDEAQGPLADTFAQLDANKDGKLDRGELRKFAAQFASGLAKPGKPRPPQPGVTTPDFDAFDQNADGRLTAEEVKSAPFADKLAAMDANKDGKVDRKEFEAYFRREAEKQSK